MTEECGRPCGPTRPLFCARERQTCGVDQHDRGSDRKKRGSLRLLFLRRTYATERAERSPFAALFAAQLRLFRDD
jgi:hypothetical protein